MSNTPERDKYLAWFREEQKKGLRDVKFAFDPSWYKDDGTIQAPEGTNTEDLYRELNTINAAIERGDYKVVAECKAGGTGFF